jgi:hypothetical protein
MRARRGVISGPIHAVGNARGASREKDKSASRAAESMMNLLGHRKGILV